MSEKKEIKKNHPCPCGSGLKYKRCCGKDLTPRPTPEPVAPQPSPGGMMPGMGPGGFDPSQMDPAMMAQMSQMLQRLPRGQVQRMQSLMQKAMAGQDITREAAVLEKSLPPQFKEMMQGMMPAEMAGAAPAADDTDSMSTTDARKIVEEAIASGKVSKEEGEKLLRETEGVADDAGKKSSGGLSGLWKSMTGKK